MSVRKTFVCDCCGAETDNPLVPMWFRLSAFAPGYCEGSDIGDEDAAIDCQHLCHTCSLRAVEL